MTLLGKEALAGSAVLAVVAAKHANGSTVITNAWLNSLEIVPKQ